ncbi:hypothetical protein HK101_007946 [Irineochytrium annulatum]|nr:hypothetical protein HK101_007946 [Irineochytrium annulatum]
MTSVALNTPKVPTNPNAAGGVNTGLGNVIVSDAIEGSGLGWGGVISIVVAMALGGVLL